MSGTLEEILYDLARSALAQQGDQVAELRRRAGTLIAGAALSNSVFAALAIEPSSGLGAWEVTFVLDIEALYDNLWGDRGDLPLVHRRLADVLWRARRRNFSRVQALHAALSFGIVLLGVDLALRGVALAV